MVITIENCQVRVLKPLPTNPRNFINICMHNGGLTRKTEINSKLNERFFMFNEKGVCR